MVRIWKRQKNGASITGVEAENDGTLTDNFVPAAFQPTDFNTNSFFALSDLLEQKYKSGVALKSIVTSPIALAYREEGKGIAVRAQNSPNTIIIEEKSVRANAISSLQDAELMVAGAKSNKLNGKPVVLNGSDEEKLLLLVAAKKHGLAVKNENEIAALQTKNPQAWNNVQAKLAAAQGDVPKAEKTSVEKTKDLFNLPIGPIALRMNLVDEAGREKAAARQAELVAIAAKRPADDKSDLSTLKFDDQIAAKVKELGITADDLKAARAVVDAGKGVPDGVPKFGELLPVAKPEQHAIYTAQAALRTLEIVNRIETGTVKPIQESDVAAFYKIGNLNGTGKFPDPGMVTHAQAVYGMAMLNEMKVAAGLDPKPSAAGFKVAALESLSEAAGAFRKLGHELAASSLEEVIDSYKPAAFAPAAPAPGLKFGPA